MRDVVIGLLWGLVFGLGLAVSGMTQPQKVIGFLDVAGDWDPSLVFVMASAVTTYAICFRIISRQRQAEGTVIAAAPVTGIDTNLIAGAAVFGMGWGLGGFCPGPGIASAGTAQVAPLTFLGAMVASMWVFDCVRELRGRRRQQATEGGAAKP